MQHPFSPPLAYYCNSRNTYSNTGTVPVRTHRQVLPLPPTLDCTSSYPSSGTPPPADARLYQFVPIVRYSPSRRRVRNRQVLPLSSTPSSYPSSGTPSRRRPVRPHRQVLPLSPAVDPIVRYSPSRRRSIPSSGTPPLAVPIVRYSPSRRRSIAPFSSGTVPVPLSSGTPLLADARFRL